MRLINSEARIENSSICNAKGIICPREQLTRKKTTMSNRHFNKLVDECVELGVKTVSIFGYGEPLIDRGVINKVAYCTKKGLDTFITTNASLLTLDMTNLLIRAGLKKIRFSCHGVYKNYEKVHRGLKFDDVTRKITNFIATNRTRYGGKCTVAMSVIPMHGETVEEIRKFWENAVDELEVWRPHDWAGGRDYRKVVQKKKTCGRPFRGPIQINADGKMMVCCYDFNGEMIVGDTYKNSIEEIVKGEKFNVIRKCHETGCLVGLPCVTCDQLNDGDQPLLYSSVDPECTAGKTSSTKFSLEKE